MLRKDDVLDVFKLIGLKQGDVVFSHSNLALFGPIENVRSQQDLYQFWIDMFVTYLGPEGLLVVPSFTYSFNSNDDNGFYDYFQEPAFSGMAKFALSEKRVFARTMDPMLSVMCFGEKAEKFVKDIDNHCFGPDSIWARLLAQNAKLVNLNLDCATTFLHYVERSMEVDYREDIKMKGTIKTLDKRYLETEITYFGRTNLKDKSTQENFSNYHEIATSESVNERYKLGRGIINISSFVNIMEFTRNRLTVEPNFLICRGK